MDAPPQRNTRAELLVRAIRWGFCLTVLNVHPIFSDACQGNEESCNIITKISVQEGHSVEVPLNSSKPVTDLCVWNNRTSRWVFVWEFSSSSKYSTSFKEHVSLVEGTFQLLNVSKNTIGSYKLQDSDTNCVALFSIFVWDHETTHVSPSSPPGSTPPSVTTQDHKLYWLFLLLPLAAIFMALLWKYHRWLNAQCRLQRSREEATLARGMRLCDQQDANV